MTIKERTVYIVIGTKEEFFFIQDIKNQHAFISINELEDRYLIEGQRNDHLHNMAKDLLTARLDEGLSTFYHLGEEVKDTDIVKCIALAKKYDMSYRVLIFDEKNERKYFKTSLVSKGEKIDFSFSRSNIKENKIDVIGDIHGCYNELTALLQRLGYDIDDPTLPHPDNRKILFLGDLIDRGPKSIETLIFVFNAIEKGGHYCIRGNHEEMLLSNISREEQGLNISGSDACKKTYYEFKNLSLQLQKELNLFINQMPLYYTKEFKNGNKFLFIHGNISSFNPLSILKEDCLYGSSKKESDKRYQDLFDQGVLEHTLVRGHIKQKEKFNNVFSLEDNQTFSGNLVALKLDGLVNEVNHEKFIENRILEKVDFDLNMEKRAKKSA